MAKSYPNEPLAGTLSNAERKIFYALKQSLPDEYTFFHSIPVYREKEPNGGIMDGEVDFLIVHPEKGIIVLEVKGGGISLDSTTETWHTVDSHGARHRIRNPYEQAKEYKYALISDLQENTITSRCSYPFNHAVWFPDIDTGSRSLGISPQLRKMTLDATDLAHVESSINTLFAELLGSERRPAPGIAGVDALVKYLAPNWEILSSLKAQIIDEEIKITEATKSQFKILYLLEKIPHALISGCAGSGKTLLTIEKARRLAESGQKVLVICYNINLAGWIRKCLTKTTGVEVFHFHGLCTYFAELAGVPVPPVPASDSHEEYYLNTLPELLLEALEKCDKRFDAIIVDEGQDLTSTWWVPIQELLKNPDAGAFYIFFDDNQTIYNKTLEFPFSNPLFLLNENCRNTKLIHNHILEFYKGEAIQSIGPEGREPEIINIAKTDFDKTIRLLLNRLVNQEGISSEDIIVLSPVSVNKSQIKEGYSAGNFTLTWGQLANKNQIRCSTIHSFKGLESPVVIMVEMERCHPASKNELSYIGMSRARNHLVVINSI